MKIHTFVDRRDGNQYRYSRMADGKNWLLDNLRYKHRGSWSSDPAPSDPWIEQHPTYNRNQAGRLYSWSSARSACIPGWRLPKIGEWEKVVESICPGLRLQPRYPGAEVSEDQMREITDVLQLVPAPVYNFEMQEHFAFKVVDVTCFWSASRRLLSRDSAFACFIGAGHVSLASAVTRFGFSVRCVER